MKETPNYNHVLPGSPEGLGPVELDASSNLLDPGAVGSLHHLLLDLQSLLDSLGGSLGVVLLCLLFRCIDLLGSWLLLLGLVSLLGFRLSFWSHFCKGKRGNMRKCAVEAIRVDMFAPYS